MRRAREHLPKDELLVIIARARQMLDRMEALADEPALRCECSLEFKQDIEDGFDGQKHLGAFWHAELSILATLPRKATPLPGGRNRQ